MPKKPKTPRWLLAARAAGASPDTREKPAWLSRALSRAGVLPLAESEAAIAQGRVRIDGRVVTSPFAPVPPTAVVRLDGRAVSLDFPTHVLAFHKPRGVVTSKSGSEGAGTVFEALSAVLEPALRGFEWHAVGRLDRDTTGLLLFTNDDRLVSHITHPSRHLSKRYVASVLGQVTEEKLSPLRQGIHLHDGPARPALAVLRDKGVVELTLTEGKNHQVKRMLGAVGLPVTALHREAIGGIVLSAPPGEYRALSKEEIRDGLFWPQDSA